MMEKDKKEEMVREADLIISKGILEIRRQLISSLKRIEYLEGKEFYDSIKKDIENARLAGLLQAGGLNAKDDKI